jgi:hypothetical protein
MWSKLRDAVAGIAEQAGIEVPGLESATTVVTDLASSAGEGVSGVVADIGGSDAVGTVTDAVDAVAVDEVVAGTVDDASTAATGLVESIAGDLTP